MGSIRDLRQFFVLSRVVAPGGFGILASRHSKRATFRYHCRLAALLVGVLLTVQAGADAAETAPPPGSSPQVNPQNNPGINEAQRLVFMNDHLGNIASGSVLNYAFARTGKAVEAFSDTVKVKVTGVQAEGRRDLEFDFLTGPNHVDFHPAKAYLGNPVAIHFLERDIREMARRSGGDSGYFRNRLRKSFVKPEIHAAKIDVEGTSTRRGRGDGDPLHRRSQRGQVSVLCEEAL